MNQFQPMASAYMPMRQPYQPYQQPYRQMPTRMVPQVSGRVVNSVDDITVQEVPMPELMAVIDQHMEAIKVVYPSEYDAIVAKVKSLHEAT